MDHGLRPFEIRLWYQASGSGFFSRVWLSTTPYFACLLFDRLHFAGVTVLWG